MAPGLRKLIICAGSEPADLFLYSQPSYIKSAILAAIYDGPIDLVNFGYTPVILDKLPSLVDGDAVIEPVQVQEGQLIVDASGSLAVLGMGTIVQPAGCNSADCAIPYPGGLLSMNQMRVIFHIKAGVQWADGVPLTADDSVFSFQVAASEEIFYGYNGLVSGSVPSSMFTAEYAALDPSTVQWMGLPGFLDMNYQLNFYSPLPKHRLSGYTLPEMMEANEVLYSPLAWGAYRVTDWRQGEQITLEPNPNYFRSWEALPAFDILIFRFLGQAFDNNLQAFADGQCDIVLQDALPEIPVDGMLEIIESDQGRLQLDLQPDFEQLIYNLAPIDPGVPAYFSDPQVRWAVAQCIDRQTLTETIFRGLIPPLDKALPADHPLLEGAPQSSYAYDLEAGKLLLEQVGWRDDNGDGIRESVSIPGIENGQPFDIRLVASESPIPAQIGRLVADDLFLCGLQVNLMLAPGRELLDQDPNALMAGRHFDLAVTASPMGVDPLCTIAGSDQISGAENGWSGANLSGFENFQFDRLCAEARNTLPGMQGFTAVRQSILQYLSNELPILPLFAYQRFTLIRPELAGMITGTGREDRVAGY